MRRILIGCLAAMAVLLLSQQQASAWCNFNFSAGVNTSWQSGGCRLLWGLVETAPGPNSSFNRGCQTPCQPQHIPMPGGQCGKTKTFFHNMFNSGYNQYDPYHGGGYGDCQPFGFNHGYGYYQYPPYGYYQYPGAEQPVVTGK